MKHTNLNNFAALISCVFVLAASSAQAKDGLKILIVGDMEGVAGAVTEQQLSPQGFEYGEFRKIYTDEVNAAIEAAFDGGAEEVVVADSHGNAQNLLLDRLNSRVTLIRGWPRPLVMMGGIDSSFDGVILIGIHAGASNMEGVLAHTLDGDLMTEVSLNGVVMSEAGICAATAGEYDVPVIMVSGDSAAADETVALLGKIETAVVKEPISYTSAKTLLPSAANALIKSKVKRAMKEIDKAEPYKLQAPITLEIKFNNYTVPQKLSNLSSVERVDARTVHFVAKDMTEVWKFFTLAFSIEY